VDLNTERQLALVSEFRQFVAELPFEAGPTTRTRYYYDNGYYSYIDAMTLYCMIRYVKPNKVIEIGSVYSSCVILDANEMFFDDSIECKLIEPYPDRLRSLVRRGDLDRVTLHELKLQDVDIGLFARLAANDILFVDSSHVTKFNSDVNRIVFEILPRLDSGVFVHFHDVFFPFEYPREWLVAGLAWNEAYLLRAFLQYNERFEIQLFNSFLKSCFRDRLLVALPLAANDPPGAALDTAPAASLWLRKT
jgi:hypothetical protein